MTQDNPSLAIIGGTGLNQLTGLSGLKERVLDTPFGSPSAPLQLGLMRSKQVIFLARHGQGHHLPPHAINYRANIWALREAGVKAVVGVAAVGGIRADLGPGSIAIADQLIDYSWGRKHSFFDGDNERNTRLGLQTVSHVEFDPPYDASLRKRLISAAEAAGIECAVSACYGCTQGPRLETAAEIRRMQQDGCDVVGMTGMPEAALAREAGLAYACVSVVVNWAAGIGATGDGIHSQIEQALSAGMEKTHRLLSVLLDD